MVHDPINAMFGIYKTRTTLVFALIHVIRKCNLTGSMKVKDSEEPKQSERGEDPLN